MSEEDIKHLPTPHWNIWMNDIAQTSKLFMRLSVAVFKRTSPVAKEITTVQPFPD